MAVGTLPKLTYEARLAAVEAVFPALAHDLRQGEREQVPYPGDNAAATKAWRGALMDITDSHERAIRELVARGSGQEWALNEEELRTLVQSVSRLEVAEQVYGAAVGALINVGDVIHPIVRQAASDAGTIHHNLRRLGLVANRYDEAISEGAHLARTLRTHVARVVEAQDEYERAYGGCRMAFQVTVGGHWDSGY